MPVNEFLLQIIHRHFVLIILGILLFTQGLNGGFQDGVDLA